MTDERNRTDLPADTDAGVTQAYRDTKGERAPEALNRSILDQAAKAARPRYSRIRSWTRPMAWAATAMLSVAIVLQLTQTPTPDEIGVDVRTIEIVPPADMPAERVEEPAGALRKTEALRSTTKEVRQREQQSKAMTAEQGLAEQEPAARALISQDQANFAAEERTFELKDQDMLQRADDMARLREGDTQEAVVTGAASAAYVPGRCDETATAMPETWLQCITSLQEAGLTDAADEERKLLAAAFPDFDTP
jgi:hypothetical protein